MDKTVLSIYWNFMMPDYETYLLILINFSPYIIAANKLCGHVGLGCTTYQRPSKSSRGLWIVNSKSLPIQAIPTWIHCPNVINSIMSSSASLYFRTLILVDLNTRVTPKSNVSCKSLFSFCLCQKLSRKDEWKTISCLTFILIPPLSQDLHKDLENCTCGCKPNT